MMYLKLFETAIVIFGYLTCSSPAEAAGSLRPIFSVITLLVTMYCKKFLTVIPSQKCVEDEDENGKYINISILDHFD